MLQVLSAVSGEAIAEFPAEDFEGKPAIVLKQSLVKCTGFSRFRQRLLHANDSSVCADDDHLTSDPLKLVLLAFCPATSDNHDALVSACVSNSPKEVEALLLLPVDPDLQGPDGWTAMHVAAINCSFWLMALFRFLVFPSGMTIPSDFYLIIKSLNLFLGEFYT